MAQSGWYPDPGGRPAHFRYWDGEQWSAQTSTDPSAPPPPPPPGSGAAAPRERDGRRSAAVLVGIVAAAVIVVLAVVLVVRNLSGPPEITSAPPSPTSSVSAWDETSEPDPSPTPPPEEGTPEPPPEEVSCPTGDPYATRDHPRDDRVRGGELSFAKVDGYGSARPKGGLTWFHDTNSQSQLTEPGWESFFAVGEIAVEEHFDTPGNAAAASMQCMINDNFFAGFTDRKDLKNEAIDIGGHPGWIVASEIRVDNTGLSVEGDVVTLIFVDDGRDDRLSGFVSTVPIDDAERMAISDDVIASLEVGG